MENKINTFLKEKQDKLNYFVSRKQENLNKNPDGKNTYAGGIMCKLCQEYSIGYTHGFEPHITFIDGICNLCINDLELKQ